MKPARCTDRVEAALASQREPRSAPTFRERVHALAGKTTWREPAEGVATRVKPIPAEHMIAAALSFGRSGPGDIGPDIAFDMATGHAAHYRVVCEWLGRMLAREARHRSGNMAPLRRCSEHVGPLAVAAYNALVRGWQCPPEPEGVKREDWGSALLFACLLLERAADDAVERAERRARA